MRVARPIAMVVALAVLAGSPAAAVPEIFGPPLHVGLGVNVASADDVAEAAELAGDHDFTVRLSVSPADGAETLDERGQAVDAALAHGWRVVVALRYSGAGTPLAFADWAAEAAGRFGPGVDFDVTSRVNALVPDPGSDAAQPGAFEALVLGVSAVRGAVPGASIGFSWLGYGSRPYDAAQMARLGALGGADLAGAVDFVSLHLYPGTLSPGTPYEPLAPQTVASDAVRSLRAAMPLAGLDGDVAIDVGEFGFAVAEDEPHDPVVVNAHDLNWARRTEAAQARVLREIIDGLEVAARPMGVRSALWSDFADPGDCGLARLCFGLLRPDRSVRPAFDVLRFAQSGRAAQTQS